MKQSRLLAALLAVMMLLTACGGSADPGEDTAPDETPVQQPEKEEKPRNAYLINAADEALPSLWQTYEGEFLVGAAVNTNRLTEGTDFYDTLTKHYNVFVTENEMKPMYMNPAPGVFSFDAADKFVEFGEKTGTTLRGHTLIWHSQAPEWWFMSEDGTAPATREELLARMEEHITTVMSRYKGKITTWDVVNEVISDYGKGLRREDENSRYASIVGDLDGDGYDWDYIEQAFYYADAADPDAQLIINDYDLENSPEKLEDFYQMVRAMLEKGVPIDGAGIQGHLRMGVLDLEMVEAAIEKLASLKEFNPDFKVQITELDVSLFSWEETAMTKDMTPELYREHAEIYAGLFEMFRRQAAKGNLDMVVTWGVYDGASWLDNYPVMARRDAPLLFDRVMMAKPSFWGAIDRSKIDGAIAELP